MASSAAPAGRKSRTLRLRLGAVLALGLAAAAAGCDDFPRDPAGTLDRVRGGTMRVGVLTDPPWADASGAAPAGVEVALVEALAAGLGATVEWLPSGQADAMAALEKRELDLVIGGLTDDSPWKTRVALSRPWYRELIVVAGDAPAGLPTLEGVEVAVDAGTPEPALVESAGGVPVPEPADTAFRAMPEWQVPPGQGALYTLATEAHVVALPKGENAWIMTVDRFFRANALDADAALRSAVERAR